MKPIEIYMRKSWQAGLIFMITVYSQLFALNIDSLSHQKPFDEIFDEMGKIRPPYERAVALLHQRSLWDIKRFNDISFHDFDGDNKLMPIPHMLSTDEYEVLKAGVQQRARALQKFLADHYSGTKSYAAQHLIPPKVLARILSRHHEAQLQGKMSPEHIAFWYGPDIIRAPDGQFYTVEDNPGYLGGMGDLLIAKEILLKRFPEFQKIDYSPDPLIFYQNLREQYQKQLPAGEKIVLVTYPPSAVADHEEARLKKIFSYLGIATVVVSLNGPGAMYRKRLYVEKDGVYFQADAASPREKVGMIIADVEAYDLDAGHTSVKTQWLAACDESEHEPVASKDLPGFSGLYQKYFDGKVQIINGPGFDFIGDKEFYSYVEAMITFYLHEKPILKNIPTESFARVDLQHDGTLNTSLYAQVFQSGPHAKDRYVIKKVDGRGGDAVWVGAKMEWQDFYQLRHRIQQNPSLFIAQQYIPLSQVNGYITDLRLHADVGPTGITVSPVPWSRAAAATGNGKVNISDHGGEMLALIAPSTKLSCAEGLGKNENNNQYYCPLSYLPKHHNGLKPNDGMLTRGKSKRGYQNEDKDCFYSLNPKCLAPKAKRRCFR